MDGRVVKTKEGYNAFVSDDFVGHYTIAEEARAAVEKEIGILLYEAGLKHIMSRAGEAAQSNVNHAYSTLGDRVAQAFGSKTAIGRTRLRTATKKLMDDWRAYCGQEEHAGNDRPLTSPTLADLADFLSSEYGIHLSADQLSKIAEKESVSPQKQETTPNKNQNSTNNPANDKAKQALNQLKSTSPQEYEALKKIMALPSAQKEGYAIKEANIENEDSEHEGAANITFDPKKVFPIMANIFLKRGLMQIQQGNQIHTGYGPGSNGAASSNPEATTDPYQKTDDTKSALEDQINNGYIVDMNIYSNALAHYNMKANNIEHLQNDFKKIDPNKFDVSSDDGQTMCAVVGSFLSSLKKQDDVNLQPEKNITTSKHMINMKTLFGLAAQHNIHLEKFEKLAKAIQSAKEVTPATWLSNYLKKNHHENAEMLQLAISIIQSTVTV